jgi:pyruvate dehydrogenase E2 component (dihydrolipoamide acetyltransferase)
MPALIVMPSLSPTMEKGNLIRWCKNIGDEIAVGDVVAEIDTDKAIMEVEALQKGVLVKIIVSEGTHDVLVRSPLAVLRQEKDTESEINDYIAKVVNSFTTVTTVSEISSDKVFATPLAKKIATTQNIDLRNIKYGTGPGGRIVKSDVLERVSSKVSSGYSTQKSSSFRSAMIKKLTLCKQEIPHFYMQIVANVTTIMEILSRRSEADTKLTVNEFVIKAVAVAMKKHPKINVCCHDGDARYYNDVNISVAVAVSDGVLTPIVRNVENKNISQIAVEIRALAHRAKEGELKTEEFVGGGITTSNLGMCNIDGFFSIINSPQGSIVSIAKAQKAPVVVNDVVTVGHVLTIGYAVDHRVIDGVLAGEFLTTLKENLENPIRMLTE